MFTSVLLSHLYNLSPFHTFSDLFLFSALRSRVLNPDADRFVILLTNSAPEPTQLHIKNIIGTGIEFKMLVLSFYVNRSGKRQKEFFKKCYTILN